MHVRGSAAAKRLKNTVIVNRTVVLNFICFCLFVRTLYNKIQEGPVIMPRRVVTDVHFCRVPHLMTETWGQIFETS